ncbi:MAG: DNA recombination protein RmuC, partial [Candidatus Zambryskibacteria bacterium CG11_big_fil_rev_8_21_14_0_20_40_24]
MLSTNALLIITFVILLLNAVFLWLFLKRGKGGESSTDGLMLLQNQVNQLTQTIDNRLTESSDRIHQSLQHQSGESIKIIRDITERLTKLDETNKQVVSFADQLQSLQDIL